MHAVLHALLYEGTTVAIATSYMMSHPPNLTEVDRHRLQHLLIQSTQTNNSIRFTLELEFIELLSNPYYVQYLVQSQYNYMTDQRFVTYLQYLLYWTTPQYIHYISHTYSLYMLTQLQSSEYRDLLCNTNTNNKLIDLLHDQYYWHWRSFKYNRYIEHQQKQQQHTDNKIENGVT